MANVIVNDINLTNIANAIRGKNGLTNTYKVSEMAAAITNIPTGGSGGGSGAYTLSGDFTSLNFNGGWDWFFQENVVTTSDITNLTSAFEGSKLTQIVDLNCGSSQVVPNRAFAATTNLVNSPKINGTLYGAQAMFQDSKIQSVDFGDNCFMTSNMGDNQANAMYSQCEFLASVAPLPPTPTGGKAKYSRVNQHFYCCYRLREIPDDYFANVEMGTTSGYMADIFYGCCSLRKVPSSFWDLAYQYDYSTQNRNPLYRALYDCSSLDEVLEIKLPKRGTQTTNFFADMFYKCGRVANVTFAKEDGTIPVRNWSNQTLSLSYCGYASNNYNILNFNSGITADKEVTYVESDGTYTTNVDDEYQALKNDPDWFTCDYRFSRYDYASAVKTLYSLPDFSGGSGNTISFKEYGGELTDNGACRKLDEGYIAIAAARGWTVSFV